MTRPMRVYRARYCSTTRGSWCSNSLSSRANRRAATCTRLISCWCSSRAVCSKSQATGRSTLWRDGRVVWQNATDPADEGSANTGATPIEMDLVTLKPVAQSAAATSGGRPKYQYLNYPNIPGEDLLENDQVIVNASPSSRASGKVCMRIARTCSSFTSKVVSGGAKTYKEAEHPYPEPSPDGEVGWMPTIRDLKSGTSQGTSAEPDRSGLGHAEEITPCADAGAP